MTANYGGAKLALWNEIKKQLTGLDQWGTDVGDEMLTRSTPSLWGNPMWDAVDVAAGGVMPGEAQLLYGLVRALRPRLILEVGTSHGYSTIHLAAGCQDNVIHATKQQEIVGDVWTVESDESRRKSAMNNVGIHGADLGNYVAFFSTIPTTDRKFDLIFFDAGHTAEDILGYLDTLGDSWKEAVIVIHDAEFDNRHAARVAGIIKRPYIILESGPMGLAILSKGGDA